MSLFIYVLMYLVVHLCCYLLLLFMYVCFPVGCLVLVLCLFTYVYTHKPIYFECTCVCIHVYIYTKYAPHHSPIRHHSPSPQPRASKRSRQGLVHGLVRHRTVYGGLGILGGAFWDCFCLLFFSFSLGGEGGGVCFLLFLPFVFVGESVRH